MGIIKKETSGPGIPDIYSAIENSWLRKNCQTIQHHRISSVKTFTNFERIIVINLALTARYWWSVLKQTDGYRRLRRFRHRVNLTNFGALSHSKSNFKWVGLWGRTLNTKKEEFLKNSNQETICTTHFSGESIYRISRVDSWIRLFFVRKTSWIMWNIRKLGVEINQNYQYHRCWNWWWVGQINIDVFRKICIN